MPDRVVAWGTGVIIAAAALGGAVLVGGSALILWAITMTGVLLFTVSVLLNERGRNGDPPGGRHGQRRDARPSKASAPGTGHEPTTTPCVAT